MCPPHGGLCFARVPVTLTLARGAPSSATVKVSEMGARAPLPRPHQAQLSSTGTLSSRIFCVCFLKKSRCVVKVCQNSRRVVIFARLYFLVREKASEEGQLPAFWPDVPGSPDAAARPSGTSAQMASPDGVAQVVHRSCSVKPNSCSSRCDTRHVATVVYRV